MPFFPPPLADAPSAGIDPGRLIALRGLSVVAMLAVTFGVPPLLDIELPRLPLLWIVAALVAANLGLIALRRLHPAASSAPAALQLGLDLLAWGLFIACTGGPTNPLVSLLLPLVAIAAALLPERQAWALGGFSIGVYALLWQFYLPLAVRDEDLAVRLHLLGMWATFAVSVVVAVWFISRMTRAVRLRDQALADAREHALRNDWVVSLGALAAGAAHELSTPLGTLATLVEERLADPSIDPELREDLALMAVQVHTCKRALGHLTRQAGQARAEGRPPIPAAEWLRGLAQGWQTLHPHAEIRCDLAPELEALPLIPDLPLDRAIHNLVDNAVAAGGGAVEVGARCDDGVLEVTISDRGPGLAFRPAEPGEADGPGLGIGLLLARGAIERWDGRLELVTRPEGGARATVRLPLKRVQA